MESVRCLPGLNQRAQMFEEAVAKMVDKFGSPDEKLNMVHMVVEGLRAFVDSGNFQEQDLNLKASESSVAWN